MPGILPMKVIKIGSNAQTRIAQACDRCRSKKIRCDGIRPCCTQCANVGFECKTSDKLSRRAFPRGYTESLEERVRTLEAEVRELKDLLDEKDEKIDVLSKIHSHSSQPIQLPSPRRASESSLEAATEDYRTYVELDEVFKVKQSPCLQGQGSDSYLAGPSSTRAYVEAFKLKAKDKGFVVNKLGFESLFASSAESRSSNTSLTSSLSTLWSAPPRLVSDQLVNIFFQEWAPLFPVLHRPAFLLSYERFVASPNLMHNKVELAQLNLVFAIAALSTDTVIEEMENIEGQWRAALDMVITDHSIDTLQALVLAQIYCLRKGDLSSLLTYKGLASTISMRLGLQQAQRSFALDTLASEIRKKLFWTLYTLDCFSALVLGLPKQIKDDEVFCEYPVDADDEYITEKGFQPALPGEATRLSCALALFKATRILSRVLEEVFPAKTSYELSLKTLSDLSDELELWEAALPDHLRLQFAQDKPSTGTITSRSPILSLVYHYIRALIQRPAVCSKSLGNKSSSAIMIHAASCKRIVQIFQLLNERSLSFSFCLNKDEVLLLSGLGLLAQRMELDNGSKISKDNQKTIVNIVELLNHNRDSSITEDFRQLVAAFMPTLQLPAPSTAATSPSVKVKRSSKPSISRSSSDQVIPLAQSTNLPASARKHLRAIASRFGSHAHSQRLSTSSTDGIEVLSTGSGHAPLSLSPVTSNNGLSTSPPSDAPLHPSLSHSPPDSAISRLSGEVKRHYSLPKMNGKRVSVQSTNLDYLSFGNEPEQETFTSTKGFSKPIKTEPQPTDWERLLGNLDNGTTNIFDACYGGPAIEALPPDALLDLDYGRRTSVASKDAALAWNTGLLSLQEGGNRKYSHADDSSGWTTDSSSHLYSEHGVGNGSAADLSTTDWTSDRGSSGNDALSALVFGDVGTDCDFDLGIDWQEALTTSNDWT